MAGKKEFIQQQTLPDLIRNLGEEHQSEGLHVFETEKITNELPFYTPIRADHFTIFIVRAGNILMKLNLMEYTVRKNGVVIITPETVGQLLEVSANWRGTGMGFTTDFMFRTGIHRNHIESFDFFASQGTPVLQLEQQDADILQGLFDLLLQKNLTKDAHPFRKEVVLHSFSLFMYELAAIYSKYRAGLKIKLGRKEDLLIRFLKLLPAHFKEERTVQYYAGLLFVTPKYLTEAVKEITGKTAGEFIDEIVITEAKLLLLDPSLSVSKVAESLFFSDQFIFSKFFKKQVGFTPSAYRKAVYK